LTLLRLELRTLGRPVRSQSLFRLHYPAPRTIILFLIRVALRNFKSWWQRNHLTWTTTTTTSTTAAAAAVATGTTRCLEVKVVPVLSTAAMKAYTCTWYEREDKEPAC
jgi:hypothetical protein